MRARTAPVDTVDGLAVRLGHLRTARGTTERGHGKAKGSGTGLRTLVKHNFLGQGPKKHRWFMRCRCHKS